VTVTVSCSPVLLPEAGETLNQLADSLKDQLRVEPLPPLFQTSKVLLSVLVAPSQIEVKVREEGLKPIAGTGAGLTVKVTLVVFC